MSDLMIRFVIGGLVVTAFAMLGDLFKPKSFAGLFGAAPSVALASLTIAVHKHGKTYGAIEARSMMAGAAALFVYCLLVIWLLKRDRLHAMSATTTAIAAWFVTAFSLWYVFLK
ncbi:MAG TPA: DUF3147 family protein [Terriglobales bacterium]|nr:DUF3147 family protein [Terriglobales bacterium]